LERDGVSSAACGDQAASSTPAMMGVIVRASVMNVLRGRVRRKPITLARMEIGSTTASARMGQPLRDHS
jgi:hypothetical protein